jgi:hypothetical protein
MGHLVNLQLSLFILLPSVAALVGFGRHLRTTAHRRTASGAHQLSILLKMGWWAANVSLSGVFVLNETFLLHFQSLWFVVYRLHLIFDLIVIIRSALNQILERSHRCFCRFGGREFLRLLHPWHVLVDWRFLGRLRLWVEPRTLLRRDVLLWLLYQKRGSFAGWSRLRPAHVMERESSIFLII